MRVVILLLIILDRCGWLLGGERTERLEGGKFGGRDMPWLGIGTLGRVRCALETGEALCEEAIIQRF